LESSEALTDSGGVKTNHIVTMAVVAVVVVFAYDKFVKKS